MTTEGFTFADEHIRIQEHLSPDEPLEQAIEEVRAVRNEILLHALDHRTASEVSRDLAERLDRIEWILANL